MHNSGVNEALGKSLDLYQKYLPKKISTKTGTSAETLREISKLFCRVNLLGSSPQVMQEFYMYFARHLYKVDLAQYFTPYEVVEFIVNLVNPHYGDSVKDPACGSADFLVAAYRIARERHKANIADQVHGSDTGPSAVQISVLNMILNGDGKSNIKREDSLADLTASEDKYTVMLCNPPFGKDILEKRQAVLKLFDLGNKRTQQETGILFVEVCVRSVKPGQRVAIILPNGYLGNRSEKYLELRKWILTRTKLVAVIGFPRFTFKKSGADVSASVVVMEKRDEPLKDPHDSDDHPCHFNVLEKVGWDVRNKRAAKQYRRSDSDGSLILDDNNEPTLDADFDRVLNDLYASPVVDAFPWIADGIEGAGASDGWAVQMSSILEDDMLIIDPKRWCPKYRNLTDKIEAIPHFCLGDVLEFVHSKFKKKAAETYRYVEIEKIYESFGSYEGQEFKGWNLAGRAKHVAQPGDIFIAHIWSSVGKWFMAGADAAAGDLIVTSGCYHLRVKAGKEALLPDLIFGLSTEMFRVQMRALATGSDGLSVVGEKDLQQIMLPRISNKAMRDELKQRIDRWTTHGEVLSAIVADELKKEYPDLALKPRPSHVAQV